MSKTTSAPAKPAPVSSIRLQPVPTNAVGDLYNSYFFLMQLAGLYAQASQIDHHEASHRLWSELADQALTDLGDLFQIWEALLPQANPPGADPKMSARIRRACHRGEHLVRLLDVWAAMPRWVRCLRHCESSWGRFLEAFAILFPTYETKLLRLSALSADRQSRLAGLGETYAKERDATEYAYRISQKLAGGG